MPVHLAEDTLSGVGLSVSAAHWIDLLGADVTIKMTGGLDTNTDSHASCFAVTVSLVSVWCSEWI